MLAGWSLILLVPLFPQGRLPDSDDARNLDAASSAVDQWIDRGLAGARIEAAPMSDDSEFLRRVTLDLTGLIPTVEETEEFLRRSGPHRREERINELLRQESFGRHLATIWHEQIAPPDTSSLKGGGDLFTPWLAERFNENHPWNEVVRALLTSEGSIRKTPQAGFILANCVNGDPQPELLADATARLFWGIQLRCAECHDHPFAPWKQEDFWGTAAFFSRLRKGYADGKNPAGYTLTEAEPDEAISQRIWKSPVPPGTAGPAILLPASARKAPGTIVRGKFLGSEGPEWIDQGPFRARFAEWATSPKHPFFVKNIVNRMWDHLFGRGLVHPLDGLGSGASASHPEILELLSKEFAESGQDLKHLVRVICNTRAYQRTSRGGSRGAGEDALLGRMSVKVMRPEVFYDSLSLVLYPPFPKPGAGKARTGVAPASLPEVSRAEFTTFFAVQRAREGGSAVNPGIPQFLRLLNGALLNHGSPGLRRAMGEDRSGRPVVESLYLAVYSRRPTPEEKTSMEKYLEGSPSPEEGAAGILWALLNSSEFVLNH